MMECQQNYSVSASIHASDFSESVKQEPENSVLPAMEDENRHMDISNENSNSEQLLPDHISRTSAECHPGTTDHKYRPSSNTEATGTKAIYNSMVAKMETDGSHLSESSDHLRAVSKPVVLNTGSKSSTMLTSDASDNCNDKVDQFDSSLEKIKKEDVELGKCTNT